MKQCRPIWLVREGRQVNRGTFALIPGTWTPSTIQRNLQPKETAGKKEQDLHWFIWRGNKKRSLVSTQSWKRYIWLRNWVEAPTGKLCNSLKGILSKDNREGANTIKHKQWVQTTNKNTPQGCSHASETGYQDSDLQLWQMHNTAFGSEIVSVVIGRNNLIASGRIGIF